MAATVTPSKVTAETKPNPQADLTTRLTETLLTSKKPGEIVRVKRISASNYRVNYMTILPTGRDLALNSYQISRSKFLYVQDVDGQLIVEDRTR
jgi:hypothetical protein